MSDGTKVTFPIGPDEFVDLAAGLFTSLVALRYHQELEINEEPAPLSAQTKHKYIVLAIQQTIRSFPEAIKPKFEDAVERMAAELIGGELLFEAS
jgi:hypothetical protein